MWTDKPLTIRLREAVVTSCLILPSSCVFVAMYCSFSFYTRELDHVKDFSLLVDGFSSCYQFKPLKHSQTGSYIMLANVLKRNKEEIDALNIQHSYTGSQVDNFVLAEVNLNEKASPPEMECIDLQNKAIQLDKLQPYDVYILELGKNKLLVDDLVIDQFEVVAKVQKPDGVRICHPIHLPFYDQEQFPFVISQGHLNDFFLINVKDMTM